MSNRQEKWQANMAKVAFVKNFPGLLKTWDECRGKKIVQVIPLTKRTGTLLIMEDKTFTVVPKLDLDPAELQEGLRTARNEIGEQYAQAYTELERLAAQDRELTRRSRLDNILSAIQNNISDIPELKKELEKLLTRLPDRP